MWTANRAASQPQPHRTGSIHSIGSVHSASRPVSMTSPQLQRRSGGYESDQSSDTAGEDEFLIQNANFPPVPVNNMPAMWQSQRTPSAVSRLSQKFGNANVQVAEIQPAPLRTQHRHQQELAESSPDDDTHSRSSTLNGSEQEFEFPEKTPTSIPKQLDNVQEKQAEPKKPPHVSGPLETQLAALMSKLVFMERENPTVAVTPEEYKEMKDRLKVLEEEKKTWQKRHEALFALRDEDVENNIKIRGMLAKARRDLEGMTKLRDEDLVNVQIVRNKLAEATRKLDRLEREGGAASGGRSPSSGRARPGSVFLERRDTTDLFAAAKAAAFQQRALELEKRNEDLLSQINTLKGGANIDDLNRMTAHQAWKDTVSDLEAKLKAKDAEIARLRSSGGSGASSGSGSGSGSRVDWHRMEAIHEEHASYREKVGGRMQQLRSEKEVLQRELHRKEDENDALEAKVQNLQRRLSVM
ncbi:hypothetical protein K469DRAFT_633142 [Zopfia rhizophila CBS 207.26]|uniref:Uncharacterized protein n=1 Tax=Zopfia rhizophila CBS 207.26 TaxID=1314779 RepID=A0A6A6E0S5_9PEZI|nr:hypothetical protein K469DRAFT_633142 [Zopfia rhizophila CBS 207.26]